MPTLISENKINGVNLDVLKETLSAVQNDPELAKCHFKAQNKWIGSTQNRSIIKDFYAAKENRSHDHSFTLDADEPPMLAGDDQAPNPVEFLLHALASCVTTSVVAHAAVRGIEIEELESELEGDIDLRGFFGIDESIPKGYTNIRVKFKVKTDPTNLQRLKQLADFSPVYNTITKGARVDLQFEPK